MEQSSILGGVETVKPLYFLWIMFVMTPHLCCMIGCAKQHRNLEGAIRFEVDGVKYWVTRYVDIDMQGQVASSSLVVRHDSEPDIGGSTQYNSQRGTTIVTMNIGGKNVVAKANTLYFIQGRKIKFEKEFHDLGIDASQLNTDLDDMLIYLQPILERMIRENVNSQTVS